MTNTITKSTRDRLRAQIAALEALESDVELGRIRTESEAKVTALTRATDRRRRLDEEIAGIKSELRNLKLAGLSRCAILRDHHGVQVAALMGATGFTRESIMGATSQVSDQKVA
jgi:chromosome segregation ATPase